MAALDPKNMKMVDLQRELKNRGQKKLTGLRKQDLVDLLEKTLQANNNEAAKLQPVGVIQPQNKLEDEDFDVDIGLEPPVETKKAPAATTTPVTSASTVNTAPLAMSASTAKAITTSTTPAATAPTTATTSATTTATTSATTTATNSVSSSATTSATTTATINTTATASAQASKTDQEKVDKIKERASRFGLPLRQDKSVDAKSIRKERFGLLSEDEQKEKRAEKFGLVTASKAEALRQQRQERFKRKSSDVSGTLEHSDQKRAKRMERFGVVAQEDKVARRKERFGDTKVDAELGNLTRRRNGNGKYKSRGTFNRKQE